jgi:hypothetical protein
MKRFLRMRLAMFALGVSVVALTVQGQTVRQLYLVTGYATNNSLPQAVASKLIAIDEGASRVVHVADLSEGASFITADHDRRLVVIGTVSLLVINMDSPSRPRPVPVQFGFGNICSPNASIVKLCGILAVSPTDIRTWKPLGVDLVRGNSNAAAAPLTWAEFRTVRTEGFWSPGDLIHYIYLHLRNGKLFFLSTREDTALGIPAPPVQPVPDPESLRLLLNVSNDDMFVIAEYGQNTRVGEVEAHTFHIYDKKSAVWRKVRLEALPSLRAFGPWIATARAISRERPDTSTTNHSSEPKSPAASVREKFILNPKDRERDQANLDMTFQNLSFLFPGQLDLYNIRSERKYTVQTGQEDSEILLVDGNAVYYRINETIYRATIGRTAIQNPVRIVSDKSLLLAHWAFLGPRLHE